MATVKVNEALCDVQERGFDFDLCKRNNFLEKQGLKQLKPWSTGTTIAGVVFKVRKRKKESERERERERERTQIKKRSE